ncbi:MAG: hypothetical protein FOGNACKC_02411 [Anaerolineae bacterium]|nr:hypothetical protein [Anaerolineae bacterium]
MSPWREFFILNEPIVLFVYGQVFFLLGLAIIWQSRRHSQLDLARSLGWLGVFGLAHGLHEWGAIFIPIQAEYLSQVWVDILLLVRVCLLALSFACLFQFGVETLRPFYPNLPWLQLIPAGLLLVWFSAFMWASQATQLDPAQLLVRADIWARYLLGFFGALVAALALRQQTRQLARLEELSQIGRIFSVASLALVSYAIFAGLLVRPASFFPANVLNSDTVINWVGLPPEVLRSLVGLVLVVSIVRGLQIFEVEVDRRLERMEQAQILQAERERVSRELHDGAIQTVYTAGLIAESIRKKMGHHDPLRARLDQVISALNHAIRDLRQFITELEPGPPGSNLVKGLRSLAEDPRLQSLIKVNVTIDCDDDDLFSQTRTTHILAIVNEAISNVLRHAQARNIWAVAERCNDQLKVTIADDGIGLPETYAPGFGLRNMRDRARILGGTLHLEPRPPQGFQVVLLVPWEDPR